jgi:nucleoside H+ symporter
MLIGAQLSGKLVGHFTTTVEEVSTTDWNKVWMYPAVFSLVILVVFVVLFRVDASTEPETPEAS